MPSETVVSVKQFRLLKGTRRQSVAVRLTPKQWERAIEGLTYSSGKPPAEFRGIRLVETPGLGGGFALPECPPPCQFRFQDGKFQCACTAPNDPPEGGGGHSLEFCALVMEATGTIRCVGLCAQSGQRCKQTAWRIPGARISLVTCGCGR